MKKEHIYVFVTVKAKNAGFLTAAVTSLNVTNYDHQFKEFLMALKGEIYLMYK